MTEVHYPLYWFQVVVPAVLTVLVLLWAGVLAHRDRNAAASTNTGVLLLGQGLAVASAATVVALVAMFVAFNPYSSARLGMVRGLPCRCRSTGRVAARHPAAPTPTMRSAGGTVKSRRGPRGDAAPPLAKLER